MSQSIDQQMRAERQFRQFALRIAIPTTLTEKPLPGAHTVGANTETQSVTRPRDISLLPEHHTLVVNLLTGGVTLVNWQSGRFLAHTTFDDDQLPILLTLLEQWPSYVPIEKFFPLVGIAPIEQLLDDLERVRVSGYKGETEHEHTLDLLARERIQPVLQPLRSLIASCIPTLNTCFGITIASILDTGPILHRYIPFRSAAEQPSEKQTQEEKVPLN